MGEGTQRVVLDRYGQPYVEAANKPGFLRWPGAPLVIASLLIGTAVELWVSYNLPTPGRSRFGPILAVLLCGAVIFGLGVATVWLSLRRKARPVLPARRVLAVGCSMIAVAASMFAFFSAVPTKVSLVSRQLTRLVGRVEASVRDPSGCVPSPHSFPSVPTLGPPDSICVSGGVVAFLRGPTDNTYGLVYVPPAIATGSQNAPQPLNVSLAETYGCVNQLSGGWWEVAWGGWSDGGVKGNGSCPFGPWANGSP